MYRVADQIVEILEKAGIKRIYGIVGDSLNPVTDALRRRKTIEWIHVRHEEVAAFAASAEAQLSGNLAVCCGSSGPGNLHLINGLFDATGTMPRAGHCLPYPTEPGRHGIFPGHASGTAFQGMQRICGTGFGSFPGPVHFDVRHSATRGPGAT